MNTVGCQNRMVAPDRRLPSRLCVEDEEEADIFAVRAPKAGWETGAQNGRVLVASERRLPSRLCAGDEGDTDIVAGCVL